MIQAERPDGVPLFIRDGDGFRCMVFTQKSFDISLKYVIIINVECWMQLG